MPRAARNPVSPGGSRVARAAGGWVKSHRFLDSSALLVHDHLRTERYRFVRFEIEDVDGVPRMLLGGDADVTRGGGLKFDKVVFLAPNDASRGELRLKKGHV